MIVNFAVQNFGSIKERQILSFEADKSTHLEDSYIINIRGKRLLKLALIYGANASGKTTVLQALDFLRSLVVHPKGQKTDELDFSPYLFDAQTPKQNSVMNIEFYQNEEKYLYEVEFCRRAIVSEKLYFHQPNKAIVFKRETNMDSQYTTLSFGSKFPKNKEFEQVLAANTLWNNTVLGGYLKTNIEFKILKEVTDWFQHNLKPIIYANSSLESFVNKKIDDGEISESNVVSILKKADINISNILLQKQEEIPKGLITFLKSRKGTSDEEIKILEEKSKKYTIKPLFEHEVNSKKYTLPIDAESHGTIRYYGFAGLLSLLISRPNVLTIDELESSLHPDLYTHFLLSFLLNSKHSQIIATTHNREIFDNKDIFRKDAIWFTNKTETCATELYSLADFDTSVIRDTTNILNAYKSGKLSGTPDLGDAYIDLE
ncbi:MAG TPA: ATP-binding protein [Tenuifilaceae bacterium]|nr:ATP-binding protein [Tenuifilaceae bacterium]